MFIEMLKQYSEDVKKALEIDFSSKKMPELYSMIADMSKGGKHIRAFLIKVGYEMFSNKENTDIIVPSIAIELFQTGILIHDDIIDKSPLRRDKPTVHIALRRRPQCNF